MAGEIAPYAMGCVHILALAAGLVAARGRLCRPPAAVVGFGTLTALGMAVSLAVHGLADAVSLCRLVMLLVMMANLFLVFPAYARRSGTPFLVGYARAISALALGVGLVGLYAWWAHGPFPTYYARLGRPLEPRTMGSLLLLGFICSTMLPGSPWATMRSMCLAAGVAATGTRSSLILMAAYVVRWAWAGRRLAPALAIGAPSIAVGVLLSRVPGLNYLARRNITSGRVLRWVIALADVLDHWLLGVGAPYRMADPYVIGLTHRPHNALVESLASYGVTYAVGVHGLYMALLAAVWRIPDGPATSVRIRAVRVARWLVAAVIVESCVGTSMWTNLGDGFTISAVLFASITSALAGLPERTRRPQVTGTRRTSAPPPADSSTVPTTR